MNAVVPFRSDPLVGKPFQPSNAQFLRRLISSFRHGSRKVPWGELDYRAWKAANRIDSTAERAALRRSEAERPVLDDSDAADHDRTAELAQRAVARSVWAGGA